LERRALLEACDEAGLSRSVSVDESIAGALGCGWIRWTGVAHMVVDVVGGLPRFRFSFMGGMALCVAVVPGRR